MEVDGSKELSHDLQVKVHVEHDKVFNAKLLHQVQCLTKVVPVLPQMIDTNPLHWNIDVVLGLDHIDVDEILLLGLEQLIPFDIFT